MGELRAVLNEWIKAEAIVYELFDKLGSETECFGALRPFSRGEGGPRRGSEEERRKLMAWRKAEKM